MRAADLRVELQAEVDGQREGLFPLVSTADGLATWMDAATLDARVGGGFRFRLLDGVAEGRVVVLAPVQPVVLWRSWFERADGGGADGTRGAGTSVGLSQGRHVGLQTWQLQR